MSLNLELIFKKVSCPKCHTKQPYFRVPMRFSEFAFGGYTCKTCGTIMDKHGNEFAFKRIRK